MKIKTRSGGNHLQFTMDQILYCKAEGSYSRVFAEGDSTGILISKSLSYFIKLSRNSDMVRCHRTYLVNIKKIGCFCSRGRFLMVQGQKIPVSRRKLNEIITVLLDSGVKDNKIMDRL
jgi:two-component system LytT family response regulator